MADVSAPATERASFLGRILADARDDVRRRETVLPFAEVRSRAADSPPPRDFRAALAQAGLSLVAEFKRASPSKGEILPGADPARIARAYACAGARAISVLTNKRYFRGSEADLRAVRAAVDLPILRKDFTVSAYDIYEARAMGADAVLLIVAALSESELCEYLALAGELGLAAVVEVHDEAQVARAVAAGSRIIGINNRDLDTFETTLATTERLRPLVRPGALVVSESGIHTRSDVARVRKAGVDAILVGESLMRAAAAADSGEVEEGLVSHIQRLVGT